MNNRAYLQVNPNYWKGFSQNSHFRSASRQGHPLQCDSIWWSGKLAGWLKNFSVFPSLWVVTHLLCFKDGTLPALTNFILHGSFKEETVTCSPKSWVLYATSKCYKIIKYHHLKNFSNHFIQTLNQNRGSLRKNIAQIALTDFFSILYDFGAQYYVLVLCQNRLYYDKYKLPGILWQHRHCQWHCQSDSRQTVKMHLRIVLSLHELL